MTWPTAFGRKIPNSDWEGDDVTPGAGGQFVTCCDTSTGRMAFWATNGRVNVDGRTIRSHILPHDPNGITMQQAAQGLHSLTGLTLVLDVMTLSQKVAWLRAHKGLVVPGWYGAMPRTDRFQAFADFTHSEFAGFVGWDGVTLRKHDPLNPNTRMFGETMPLKDFMAFLDSRPDWPVGFVELQHL